MGNIVIGVPSHTSKATFSADGGSWAAAYPVTNLGNLPLARVARTTNALVASTKFLAVLDKDRPCRVFGLIDHNMTTTATFRLRLYSDVSATALLYDTGVIDVWPTVYPYPGLEWEDDTYWTGKYTTEQITGYRWTRPLWLPATYMTRAIRVELFDSGNPAGYLQLGRFELAQGWQPTINYGFGASRGYRFRTAQVEALGGVSYFERRDKPRVFRGAIDYLPVAEGSVKAFEFLRQHDIDVPFLVIPDPDDTNEYLRNVFLARNVNPGPLTTAMVGREQFPFEFHEVL